MEPILLKWALVPGSVCTTRIQTGVGYPQLSAVIECADAHTVWRPHPRWRMYMPHDVAKASLGGADFVMLGGMLVGHDQGGGEVITKHYATGEQCKRTR